MAKSVHPRRPLILTYIAIGIGLLALALFCALSILLGSMRIDVFLTESYFVVAHIHWLRLSCVLIGITAITALARSLYARRIGS
jgi:heme/copper-type cytochrome/quinol oxidase subunit 1